MNILYVASRFPYPLLQGDRVRAYQQLRVLAERHRITLLSPEPEREREHCVAALSPFCQQIFTVATPTWRRLWRLVKLARSQLPVQTLYFFEPQLRQLAAKVLRSQSIDLVHVQLVRMAPIISNLSDVPTVLDFIDALSLNFGRRAQRESGARHWACDWEAQRLKAYERRLTSQYDELVVTSELDRQAIGDFDNLHVVPNGVALDGYPFIEEGRDPATILFSGRMNYFPNADAATWFASEVFPLVKAQVPRARFIIAGADPSAVVQRLAETPGIEVLGYVPRLQDFLQQTTLAIAPMQAGSGIQNKVLEAMACGAPVVATLFALGGLSTREGEHLLVGQNAAAFAEAVLQLLHNPALCRKLAQGARQLMEDEYSWQQSVSRLEQVYIRARQRRGHGQRSHQN
jgi:polysaccharide biosynthesis protein PslH